MTCLYSCNMWFISGVTNYWLSVIIFFCANFVSGSWALVLAVLLVIFNLPPPLIFSHSLETHFCSCRQCFLSKILSGILPARIVIFPLLHTSTLSFKSFGSVFCIYYYFLYTIQFILFTKYILNWPKVTVKTFMTL